MPTRSNQNQHLDEVWEQDFDTPSDLGSFMWPEGAELRGNINLVDGKMIDRVEVDAAWDRIKKKLLRCLT